MQTRIKTIIKESTKYSSDDLPRVPKSYPEMKQTIAVAGKRTFVASNDSHARNSNNGYSRGTGGAFYCH